MCCEIVPTYGFEKQIKLFKQSIQFHIKNFDRFIIDMNYMRNTKLKMKVLRTHWIIFTVNRFFSVISRFE